METIVPKDEKEWLALRIKDVTSTESAALFGISPYQTLFELWHRKREGTAVAFEPSERMQWGNRLQDAIARGVAEDNKWHVRPKKEYIRDEYLRMGSSFDYHVFNPAGGDPQGDFIMEVKNVDAMAFRDGWLIDEQGNVEAPPHIEMQVQHQLAVTGLKKNVIAALVGGNRVILIERKADEMIQDAIKGRIAYFWATIEAGEAPSPDFKRDADFIAELYKHAEPGQVFDAQGNTEILAKMLAYRDLGNQVNELDAKRSEIKAEILSVIGAAEKVVGDGFSISTGLVAGGHVEYDRDPYRMFTPRWKKAKA